MLRATFSVLAFVVMATQSRAAESPASPHKAAEATAVRTITFAGGSASVERVGDSERVVVSHRDGKLLSESWCDQETGSYDELVALFRRSQRAVVAKDRRSVASLVRFPLQVNGANAEAVFCRHGQAMLGNGVVWGHVDHGQAGVDVVNP